MKANNESSNIPIPHHFEPDRVGEVYKVPYQDRAQAAGDWAARYAIKPSAGDQFKIALIIIDMQNTFCLPDFELYVGGRSGTGAVDDIRRLCEFIYRNLGSITNILATMDTHHALQIFHPLYLVNEDGEHPGPNTQITYEDVRHGRWKFNPEVAGSLGISPQQGQEHLLVYTEELKKRGKYDLTIWPYHAMLGGIGHALVPALEEAIFFHTVARKSQANFIIKGQYPNTESYSAIGPEVRTRLGDEQIAEKNKAFLKAVIDHDMVVIAGEAKSHCVAWTVSDLLEQIRAYDASLAGKLYLLEDCASAVVVPGVVDFTDQADAAYQRFADAGMHVVYSTDPIAGWLR